MSVAPDKFILTVHNYKEGRTTAQFFPTREAAYDHGTRLQAAFPVDVYVSEVFSYRYGAR